MGQIGIVYRGEVVQHHYAERQSVVFTSSGGTLGDFIQKNHLDGKSVEAVMIQKDFSSCLMQPMREVAYVHPEAEKPASTELIDNYSPIVKVISAKETSLAETIEGLRKKGIREIGVSGFREESKIAGVETTVQGEIRNQIMRENFLLFNLMITRSVREFIEGIKNEMAVHGIKGPLYFMTGSGDLSDEAHVAKRPMLTWRSGEALELLTTGRSHYLDDLMYVKRNDSEYRITVMKGDQPVTHKNYCRYRGYELPPWFVKITQCKISDFEATIKYLKRIHGEMPMMIDSEDMMKELRYRRFNNKNVLHEALFLSPYRKSLYRQINLTQEHSIAVHEENMRNIMEEYLVRQGIVLRNRQYTLEKEYRQYSLESIVSLRLGVTGWVASGTSD